MRRCANCCMRPCCATTPNCCLPNEEAAGWSVLGDPTEGALLVLAAKAGIDLDALRSAAPREAEMPFDADTKMMATRHRFDDDDAARRVFVKGAPEAVLRLCAAISAAGGARRCRRDGGARPARARLRRASMTTRSTP